jgi:hypothetical protein
VGGNSRKIDLSLSSFGNYIMVKTNEKKKPFIGFVNDKRSSTIDCEDTVSVLWMYRKEDVAKNELRRLETVTPLLTLNKELFFSHHQDTVPVQSVFDKLKVREEFICDDRRGSPPRMYRVLAQDEMLCRFMYNHMDRTVSDLRRDNIPASPSTPSSSSGKRSGAIMPPSPATVDRKRKRSGAASSQAAAGMHNALSRYLGKEVLSPRI